MKRVFLCLAFLSLFTASVQADEWVNIKIITNQGDISLALNKTKAPITVENITRYINEGFYKDVIFHRVIKDFMAQAGGFDKNMKPKAPHKAIKNEANNGLKNVRGSIAMARSGNPHSATSQFFINLVDNRFLNHTAANGRGWGYAVFGKVTAGMDVADKIATLPTGAKAPLSRDVPQTPVIINSIEIIE